MQLFDDDSERLICNVVDKYSNGSEMMDAIVTLIENHDTPNVVNIIEQVAGLPKGELDGYVQCMAPRAGGNFRVGDVTKRENFQYGPSYFLFWREITAISLVPSAQYNHDKNIGAVWGTLK